MTAPSPDRVEELARRLQDRARFDTAESPYRLLTEAAACIRSLRDERDALLEQLGLRQPSALERNMQEIMRINNEQKERAEAAEARVAELERALSEAATAFREYQHIHESKNTTEGNAKAVRNETLADLCESALKGDGNG